MTGETAAAIAAIAAVFGVIAAGLAAIATWKGVVAAREAVKIGARAADIAENAANIAKTVGDTQKMLSQRQLLIPLWTYMTKLGTLDATNPHVTNVLSAVHTLELVALCCEGGMVDEQVIKRTFRDVFISQYDQVSSCVLMPSLGRDGKALLLENKAAMKFYEQLKKEHMDRDILAKV